MEAGIGKRAAVLLSVAQQVVPQLVDKGHGRRETRQITVSRDLNAYLDWPEVAQVFRLERERVGLRRGELEALRDVGKRVARPAGKPPSLPA